MNTKQHIYREDEALVKAIAEQNFNKKVYWINKNGTRFDWPLWGRSKAESGKCYNWLYKAIVTFEHSPETKVYLESSGKTFEIDKETLYKVVCHMAESACPNGFAEDEEELVHIS